MTVVTHFDIFYANSCTVEPLYNGHYWGMTFCPLYRGVLNREVQCFSNFFQLLMTFNDFIYKHTHNALKKLIQCGLSSTIKTIML